MYLLRDVAADVVGASFDLRRLFRGHGDSVFSVYCWATSFGGGTVTVEISPDGGTNWFTLREITGNQAIFTISDVITVNARGGHVRATLAGAVGASGLNCMVV